MRSRGARGLARSVKKATRHQSAGGSDPIDGAGRGGYQSAAPRLRDRADHFLENAKAVGTVRRALDSSGFADEKEDREQKPGEPASAEIPR